MTERLRVLFNDDIFLRQRFGGVSRVFVETAKHLPANGVEPCFMTPFHINEYLGSLPAAWFPAGRRIVSGRLPLAAARRMGSLPTRAAVRVLRPAVVHETYYAPRAPAPRGVPTVATMHDMHHEKVPDFAGDPVAGFKARSIERAAWIACVSENTRRDLVELFPAAEAKSSVVPLAAAMPAPGQRSLRPRPYILYVGERCRAYKNFPATLGAYRSLPRLAAGFDLVCAGGGPFDERERRLVGAAGLAARVVQLPASDAALATLYAFAACLVYPSVAEGFGIPLLEAMGLGCPVVALRRSSIPEVCGEAAFYADDPSAEAIAAALDRVLGDGALAARLRTDGRARAAQFSWARSASGMADIYRKVAP